jgi:hypothetical protein
MSHYAVLDENNIVVKVVVGTNDDDFGVDLEKIYSEVEGKVCKKTSYNTYGNIHSQGKKPYRYNYAGIGYTFDESIGTDGAFIPPQPFKSWKLDKKTCLWVAPKKYPNDGKFYIWNEDNKSWQVVPDVI